MNARQSRKQRGGIPAGRAAERQVQRADKRREQEIGKLAEWLGKNVFGKRSFLEEVCKLVDSGAVDIPSTLKNEAEKWGVNIIDLVAALKGGNLDALRPILAKLRNRGDIFMEEAFKAHDEREKVERGKWYEDHPEWSHDKPDEILPEWDFIKGEWLAENPGKTPKPGEVFRWQAARQKEADDARAAMARRLKAREFAAVDRDITLPESSEDEVATAFQFFRKIPWSERERWPTIEDARILTGMSQRELRQILKGGRWSSRNVWRGAVCTRAKGGRPAVRISPAGLERVIRAILKKRTLPQKQVEQARRLLVLLGRVKF